MIAFFNINGSSVQNGGSISGQIVTELLNDVTGTDVTLSTTISGGTYQVFVSTDGGTNYTLQVENTDFTRSGQNLTFASALTADIVKFEFTYT